MLDLREQLELLNEKDRTIVLRAAGADEESYANELGEELDMTPGNVRATASRRIKALGTELKKRQEQRDQVGLVPAGLTV